MRRHLVLTNEAAGHAVRQWMPRPVVEAPKREPLSNRGLFLLTFVSAFLAFSVFLG